MPLWTFYLFSTNFPFKCHFGKTLAIVKWVLSGNLGLIVYVTQFHSFISRFHHFDMFVRFLPIFHLYATQASSHHPRMEFWVEFWELNCVDNTIPHLLCVSAIFDIFVPFLPIFRLYMPFWQISHHREMDFEWNFWSLNCIKIQFCN